MSRKRKPLKPQEQSGNGTEHGHGPGKESRAEARTKAEGTGLSALTYILLVIAVSLMIFNQFQISQAGSRLGLATFGSGMMTLSPAGDKDLSNVDISELKSTAHSVAALFPLDQVETPQDAINIMIPTGTPEYGEEMGVSYDDPVNSLNYMANQMWPMMKRLKTENPEVWSRYVNLASQPVGISCEYCCGISAVGITPDGESACGCQHNPALLALTVWLMDNRPGWSDAQILKEVLRWKALFFPKDMTKLAIEVAGKDPASLAELPGMVGGC